MTYQHSWVNPHRRTEGALFNSPIAESDEKVHAFPKSISLNVNVIAWLEYEISSFKAAVQHINHYAMGVLPPNINLTGSQRVKGIRKYFFLIILLFLSIFLIELEFLELIALSDQTQQWHKK